jgi:hypothetical protein
MKDTTMTLKRSKITQRTGIPVQIQEMAWKEAADMGGAAPYDSFWIRTTGGGFLEIRRGDLLIDESSEIDPLTGAAIQYRVFGRPRNYYESFTQIPAERLLGT